MSSRTPLHAFPFLVILLLSLGCSLLSLGGAAPTPVPPTPGPLYQQVVLTSQSSRETGQPFGYVITLQTPVLIGSDDPRVQAFNSEMASIVTVAAASFKQDLQNVPPTPDSNASTFDVRYDVWSRPPIFSLQFQMEGYVTGAAHPFHTSRSVNFDLEAGRDLQLADLFIPGSDYLEVMSAYCIGQLQNRGIDFTDFSTGAAPTPDNYRNWNISDDGLRITFDEYQVAPYAAGPQGVAIPYDKLRPMILDPGPLTPYLH